MSDREAHEFYLNPEHLQPAGPGRKRKRPALTSMVPVRFTPETIEAVKGIAHTEGITVSSWIRRTVSGALRQAQTVPHPEGLIPGSGRMGAPKALRSSRSLGFPGTFSCPHMSIGGVVSASCGICGPISRAAS